MCHVMTLLTLPSASDAFGNFQNSFYRNFVSNSIRGRDSSHFYFVLYKKFYIRGGSLFGSFSRLEEDAMKKLHKVSFVDAWVYIYERFADIYCERRPLFHRGGHSSYRREWLRFSKTIPELSECSITELDALFLGWLSEQARGLAAELIASLRLARFLHDSVYRVCRAPDALEKQDVDLIIHTTSGKFLKEIPVSVKCFSAFSVKTCERYRAKSASPMIYMDAKLRFRMPDSLEVVHNRDELLTVLSVLVL